MEYETPVVNTNVVVTTKIGCVNTKRISLLIIELLYDNSPKNIEYETLVVDNNVSVTTKREYVNMKLNENHK